MKGAGLLLNCGSFRPKWLSAKTERIQLSVTFSLEVSVADSEESMVELREMIEETISNWSRMRLCVIRKAERKAKKGVCHENE
jgi:hypothetical protein